MFLILQKANAAVSARLCNKWAIYMYGRLTKEMVELTVCAARLIGCSVFVCECAFASTRRLEQSQAAGLSRYFCSFIKTERWSVLFPTCSPVETRSPTHIQELAISVLCQYVLYRCVRGEECVNCPVGAAGWLWIESHYFSHHQGKPVSVRISLVAPLCPPQHPPLPAALLPHHSRHHRQHHGQVQRHKARGESAGQSLRLRWTVWP